MTLIVSLLNGLIISFGTAKICKRPSLLRLAPVKLASERTENERLLVADVSATIGIRIITTGVEGYALLEKGNQSQIALHREITRVCESVKRLRTKAQKYEAETVVVVGTEALRRIAKTDIYKTSQLWQNVDRILNARSEALYSLIAGSFSLSHNDTPRGNCLLIDQGFGSMEIAYGTLGPPVELQKYVSLDLGIERLLNNLASGKRDLNALKRDVSGYLDGLNLPVFKPDHAIVLGSTATKYAWLKLRQNENDKYSLKRIDGKRIQTETLEEDWTKITQLLPALGWTRVQEILFPDNPGGDDVKRLVAGIIPLAYLMNRFGRKNFVVSALGTRYGLAFHIGLGHSAFFGSDSRSV